MSIERTRLNCAALSEGAARGPIGKNSVCGARHAVPSEIGSFAFKANDFPKNGKLSMLSGLSFIIEYQRAELLSVDSDALLQVIRSL